MSNSKKKQYRYLLAVAASVLAATALAASPVLFVEIKNTDIKQMGTTEVTWQDAMKLCGSLGDQWSLPSIYHMGAIFYRRDEIDLVKKTDYWSHNSIAGFAFGLNTGRGIASFDRHADTDHFICIQQ